MGSEGVEDILKFLVQGDQMIRFSSSPETILVLGDTGTGKTTLSHFLALNNDNMISVAKGRGDYVIKDNTKQICDSTIESCTVIPELVVDQRANSTAYYDCPGFSDTRSVSHDIGATYFIQEVIRRVDSVKIVFTISYDSVRQGGDRHAFMNLAKNIYSMFSNISKFEKSVCLVVTKVDNIMEEVGDDTYRLVPDDVMIQNIAGFLKEARGDLEAKIKTKLPLGDKQFYENTVALINIFTNDKEPNTPKIGIFRRPNKEGPLSKMKVLQKGKAALQKMIYQQLGYTLCGQEDFGYTISDRSKLYLNALKDGINENIKQNISKVGQQIMENYGNQEKTSDSIDDLMGKITVAYNKLSILSNSNEDQAQDFIIKLTATVNELKVEISAEHLQQINNFIRYLEFIESLMKQSAGQPIQWGDDLKNVVSYLSESKEWYRLLIELRTTLSQYIIQQDVGRYNDIRKQLVSDIADHDQERVVASLKQFLSKVNEDSGMKYVIPTVKKLDEFKLRFLKELMEVAFTLVTSECIDGKLVMKGTIIKMKDIMNVPCYNQTQILEIFGLSKVFFDFSISKPQGLLRIFSPELEVVNEPMLILDGVHGVDYEPAKQGSLGVSGHPGNPGGSAGGFVGIGLICTNCNKLSISAVGGKGGRGQDGGDGIAGKDGNTPDMIQSTCDSSAWESRWKSEGFDPQCENSPGTICGGDFCYHYVDHDCQVPGNQGLQGEKGGDGGQGGEGGHAGQVIVVFNGTRGSAEGPRNTISNGQTGDGGSGGAGGQGGKQGDTLYQSSTSESFSDKCTGKSYRQNDNKAASGNMGVANANNASLIPPDNIDFDPSLSINQYKHLIRQNMGNSVNRLVLRNLLEYMEVDQKINNFYSTTDFVDDLIVMESQIYGQHMSVVNMRTYKNFLDRITKYAQREREMANDNKLVLGYLYTSVLSKICRIQESSNIELIIDIKGYLNLVKEDIKQLEDFKNTVEKNNSKARYQKSITDKVDEANHLIDDEISPKIEETLQELRGDMQSLLDEAIALEEQAEANEIKLSDYRKELGSQMGLSVMLGIFQGVGQALGFLAPIGAMMGSIIGSVSTVSQDLANDASASSEVPDLISHLPDGVNNCLKELEEKFKKNQELFQSQLTKADEMLTEFKDVSTVADLKQKINEARTQLEEATEQAANGDRTAIEKIYEAKKELNASIKEALKLLEKQKGNQNTTKLKDMHTSMKETLTLLVKQKGTPNTEKSEIDRCINTVSKVQDIVKMAAVGVDIYGKIIKAKSSIRTLDEAIKRTEEDIEKLKDYEKAIYSIMLPMAGRIKDQVDSAVKTSAGKSRAALDVSSWEVQSAIREVKIQLAGMTAGFKTQGKIMNTIERAVYGMTTIIQVYDRIQDYYDQAQLADYISDITSDRANSVRVHVSDMSLQEAIDKLAFELQNNIVLAEYERSMSAVRQYVFPFGNYMEEYTLPIEFRVANASHTVAEVINNIVTVFERLEKDVTVIKSGDENIFPKQIFNSQDNHNPPFYVWKYSSSKDNVRQLFQGNEVMMTADIARGIQENAIKFDRIGVYFKVKCNQLQNELNKALDGFSIKLTHLGNSYYMCGHRVFKMTHGHIDIQHSVNKQDGEYFNQNEVYEKITSNDPMLSPYGMWKMQLVGLDFNKLAQYIGQKVDIELEGRGSYLNHKEDDDICTDGLKQYYEEVTDSVIQITDDSNEVVDIDEIDECENQNNPSLPNNHGIKSNTINSVYKWLKPIRNIASMFIPGQMLPTTPKDNGFTNATKSKFEMISHPHTIGGGEHRILLQFSLPITTYWMCKAICF